ncbi:MAG: peptidoglycan-binding protein [Geminicoccaceae bacterium]
MNRIERAKPILDLIRQHESDGAAEGQGAASGYDVVWGRIKPEDRPPRPLCMMTVQDILDWQDSIDPEYQSEAAGAYQIMEDTLRGLVDNGQVDRNALFDERTQDRAALVLLDRRGWASCEAGIISPDYFCDRLAREWASLPVQRRQKGAFRTVERGQSYYTGDALNTARADPDELLDAVNAALAVSPSKLIRYPEAEIGAKGLVVRHIQETLRELNYPAGKIDSVFGPTTRAALLAFQADNDLAMTGRADEATMAALEVAPSRSLDQTRAEATVADLRAAGSSTIKSQDQVQAGGLAAIGAGGFVAAAETLRQIQDMSGVLSQLVLTLEPVTAFLGDSWPFLLIGLGAYGIYQAWATKRARVADHQNGLNLAR